MSKEQYPKDWDAWEEYIKDVTPLKGKEKPKAKKHHNHGTLHLFARWA